MLIKVTGIVEVMPRKIISFSTTFGNAVGFWVGEEPVIGRNYHIEIEIDTILKYGISINKSSINSFSISRKNSQIKISGRLESVDDDGFTIIKLEDYIVSFLSEGVTELVGFYVDILIDYITLFQYNL